MMRHERSFCVKSVWNPHHPTHLCHSAAADQGHFFIGFCERRAVVQTRDPQSTGFLQAIQDPNISGFLDGLSLYLPRGNDIYQTTLQT